jgi:hypothetical protein
MGRQGRQEKLGSELRVVSGNVAKLGVARTGSFSQGVSLAFLAPWRFNPL